MVVDKIFIEYSIMREISFNFSPKMNIEYVHATNRSKQSRNRPCLSAALEMNLRWMAYIFHIEHQTTAF